MHIHEGEGGGEKIEYPRTNPRCTKEASCHIHPAKLHGTNGTQGGYGSLVFTIESGQKHGCLHIHERSSQTISSTLRASLERPFYMRLGLQNGCTDEGSRQVGNAILYHPWDDSKDPTYSELRLRVVYALLIVHVKDINDGVNDGEV